MAVQNTSIGFSQISVSTALTLPVADLYAKDTEKIKALFNEGLCSHYAWFADRQKPQIPTQMATSLLGKEEALKRILKPGG